MPTLALQLTDGVGPLLSVTSVLHARRAHVQALRYEARFGRPWITVQVAADDDVARLAELLRRRVDVHQVVVAAERARPTGSRSASFASVQVSS